MSIWSAMKHASTWLQQLGDTAKEATERLRVGMGLDEPVETPALEDKTKPSTNGHSRTRVQAGR